MTRTATQLTPADHGRRMPLEEFGCADVVDGQLYELGRGVVTVVDVPGEEHLSMLDEVREQVSAWRRTHRDQIYRLGHGSDCKVLIPGLESERHPDLAIYQSPPTRPGDIWSNWVPDIVIEIVSRSSRQRDYVDKREEYRQLGVGEYWIIDNEPERMLALTLSSSGSWTEAILGRGDRFSTRRLPGFELDLAAIFDAARLDKR